jgi:hypothetical protein
MKSNVKGFPSGDQFVHGEEIESLIARLHSENPAERERVRMSLVSAGVAAIVPLMRLLKDSNQHVRWEAAKALSEIAEPAIAPVLIDSLEDQDNDVRWLAAEALANLGQEGVRATLGALLNRGDSIWICNGAHHVLSESYKLPRDWRAVLAPVLKALETSEPAVAAPPAALTALHALPGGGSSPRPRKRRPRTAK